ncbi:RNA polymerase sigma factor [Flavitalea flava]
MRKLDNSAFIGVFEKTKDALYRLFQKLTRDEFLTEDLVQECYLRLWENRGTIQDPESFVFGIAFNLVKEFHRKRIRAVIEHMESLPEVQDLYSPDEQYDFKETSRIIRDILQDLSPEKRAAFTLIKEAGLSYKEAAETLRIPVSTLEKQVAGSIRILRKALFNFF